MSDYEALLLARRQEARQQAVAKILAKHPEAEVAIGIPDCRCPTIKSAVAALDATEDQPAVAGFDGLSGWTGASKLVASTMPLPHHGNRSGCSRRSSWPSSG